MYDAEEVFLASSSTPVIDLVTDSTSPARELQPIYDVQDSPVLPPSPAAPNFATVSVHLPLHVTSVFHPTQISAKPELGRKYPSLPQSSGGNVSLPDLISDSNLNPRLEKIFGWPFPTIISQPESGRIRLTSPRYCRD